MKYKDFKNILVRKDLSGPYLFYGFESLIMEEIIDYIKDSFLDSKFFDLNFVELSGKTMALEDFYSSIETIPFMSQKRMILISELQDLVSRFDLSELFFESLDRVSEDTIVIFFDSQNDLRKNTKLFKYFKKTQRDVEFVKLSSVEVREYIRNRLKLFNKKMRETDLSYFLSLTGYENKRLEVDLYLVKNELDKLIGLSSGPEIQRSDIDRSMEKANDTNIFNLLTSLDKKNTEAAIANLHDLYNKYEPLPLVLHMIQRRYRHLYKYLALREENTSFEDIRKELGVSNYEFKVIQNSATGQDTCYYRDILRDTLEVERIFKSSSIDELITMEHLIVDICRK